MEKINKRLVVVLGMHRSGTSAITRGLEALGVELGDHLLPAREGNNPKGFLEDVDINSLNIEMLSSFGDDWDRLSPVQSLSVSRMQEGGFLLRATETIREKLKRTNLFGFKDPRVAKLLPFWKSVFTHMQLDVSYVLALRNPLSVVRSLEKRDGLDAGKTYLLWAQHLVSSLVETEHCKRIVVDFDRIMEEPNAELERIAAHLNLQPDAGDIRVYCESFLDKGLQHTAYARNDLLLDVACPPIVIELFDAMLAGASDAASLETEAFRSKLREWQSELVRLRAPMVLIDSVTAQRDLGQRSIDALEMKVNILEVQSRELVKTIEALVLDRDSQKAGFDQSRNAIADLAREHREQVAHLAQTIESLVLDRDSQKAGFDQSRDALAEMARVRDEQIMRFSQQIETLVQVRDLQAASLERAKTEQAIAAREYDQKVTRFLQAIDSQNNTIEGLTDEVDRVRGELSAVYGSKSWRLTLPLRNFVQWLRKTRANLDNRQRGRIAVGSPSRSEHSVAVNLNLPTQANFEQGLSEVTSTYRILLVSYYCPTRAHAGGLRILDMYAMLRKKCPDIQIDLLTHHRPDIDWSIDGLESIFDNVYLSPIEDLSVAGLETLRGQVEQYDLVDLQFHQSAHHMEDFRAIASKVIFTPMESQAKVLLLDFSAKLKLGKPFGFRRITALINLAIEEVGFCRKADEVVCVSRTDASFLRAVTGSRRIRGIETGISQFEFAKALEPDFLPEPAAAKSLKIVFIAYFGSETNVVALQWFLENVHPLIKKEVPGYVLSVVGRGDLSSFERFVDGSLELIGEVPMIAPYISDARVGIAPALSGSGLRGKINQYAVLGVPCVASPIALKGLAYEDGKNVHVAENPSDFAKKCVSLLIDVELNSRISAAARQLCLERYSWQSKWPQIRAVYGVKSTA